MSLNIEDEIGAGTVIDNAKALYRQALLGPGILLGNSVSRYQEMLQLQHQEYVLAPYLSALKTLGAIDSETCQQIQVWLPWSSCRYRQH